ncbi:MAG: peptidoglycan-binding protein [Clostridia bacterium]|nr:peptidoglycan-binding protein [Clostridia bacterium]
MCKLRVHCFAWLLAICITLSSTGMADYATLEYRDSGDSVLQMQKALNALGYSTGGTDSKFGPTTEKAVRQFQKDHGLTVDGKAGNQTLTLLYEKSSGYGEASSSLAASGSSSKLKYGDKGSEVLKMQKALIALGYSTGGSDGKFGSTTLAAVRQFQKDNKLTVDGIAGLNTLNKLYGKETGKTSSTAGSAENSGAYTTLRYGSKGTPVKNMQQVLKTLGYLTGGVDGHYGSHTLQAVKAFQKANGLVADGVAGSQTLQKLYGTSAEKAEKAETAETSYDTLRTGSTGTQVKKLQQALKDLGYLNGSVDGSYGSATQKAVRTFQSQNSLTADGIAGKNTLQKLYSGNAKVYDSSKEASSSTSTATTVTVPGKGELQLLHWFNQVKPSIKTGQTLLVYEPNSGLSWRLKLYSLGRHADSEPLTRADTDAMYKAFGNQNTWNQKAVYVKLPDGRWTLASTHNMPHLSGSIKDNGFDGHLCVHFLRDMSECSKNDPKYGVANQNTIRAAWKKLTGESVH